MRIADLKEHIECIADYGDRIAFRFKKGEDDNVTKVSYRDFVTQINALGTHLMKLGLSGKHIAIVSENRYEWIVAYLAAVCVGAAVPIDRDLPEDAILYLLEEGEAAAVLYSNIYTDIIDKTNIEHKICFCERTYNEALKNGVSLIKKGDTTFKDIKIDDSRMASLLFTSGTTGFSKGVMLSHKNIVSSIYGAVAFEKYNDDNEALLSILPYHHAFECTVGVLSPLLFGATVCINDSLKYLRENMLLFKPTVMFVVPAIMNSIYKKLTDIEEMFERPLSKKEAQTLMFGGKLRSVFSGSAPLNSEIIVKFRNYGVNLLQGYGLTEASPMVSTTCFKHINDTNINSVGEIVPCCRVKIVENEIWVKGDNIMLGYYKMPEETSEVMDEGWFKTGDLGYLDNKGFLFISGRKKNLIISSGGENIYPEELEQYLYRSPMISDALVYGENEDGREVITAVIRPNYDFYETLDSSEGLDNTERKIESDILNEIASINEILPLYKHITSIKIRSLPFEKTTANKIKRNTENQKGVIINER